MPQTTTAYTQPREGGARAVEERSGYLYSQPCYHASVERNYHFSDYLQVLVHVLLIHCPTYTTILLRAKGGGIKNNVLNIVDCLNMFDQAVQYHFNTSRISIVISKYFRIRIPNNKRHNYIIYAVLHVVTSWHSLKINYVQNIFDYSIDSHDSLSTILQYTLFKGTRLDCMAMDIVE